MVYIPRGVLTQKGFAFSASVMWNFSPSIVLIRPSKTEGNSRMMFWDSFVCVVSEGVPIAMDAMEVILLGCG